MIGSLLVLSGRANQTEVIGEETSVVHPSCVRAGYFVAWTVLTFSLCSDVIEGWCFCPDSWSRIVMFMLCGETEV